MADEVTIEDYEKKIAELEAIEAALAAKGFELVSAEGKPLYKSKMFWVNIIAIGAMLGQQLLGYTIPVEEVAVVLGAVNIVLRYLNPDISGVVT